MVITFSNYFLYFAYLITAILMVGAFAFAYEKITPPKELQLIKNGNLACALSYGGAIIGFCAALVSAMTHSVNLGGFIAWGLLAAVVQIGLFFAVMKIVPDAVAELENNNVAVGTFLCSLSIGIGLLNAACLVW